MDNFVFLLLHFSVRRSSLTALTSLTGLRSCTTRQIRFLYLYLSSTLKRSSILSAAFKSVPFQTIAFKSS